jgi:phage baseplate assembly protein W
MALYKGFSTAQWLKTKSFQTTDVETIKEDLSNHIFTRIGSRIMLPGFGTSIPDTPFEPNDEETLALLIDDITSVIDFDPRVELVSITPYPLPDNNAIIIQVQVNYTELRVQGVLNIDVKSGKIS